MLEHNFVMRPLSIGIGLSIQSILTFSERESKLFLMVSEFTPVEISQIPYGFSFRQQLPRREEVDLETGLTVAIIDESRAVALARDPEYQKRLLELPEPNPEASIAVMNANEEQRKKFSLWLKTYPPAQGLSVTEIFAAQEAVLAAAEAAARKVSQTL